MHVTLLSGPNLDLLGTREPEVYGTDALVDHVRRAAAVAESHGWTLDHFQTNSEGALVDAVHDARGRADAIVVNAGALTHTSWSLHDALAAFSGVVVELHLSNPAAREPFRHTSVVAPVADGLVAGMGGIGYELAIEAAVRLADARAGTGARAGSRPRARARPRAGAQAATPAREDLFDEEEP